MSCVIVAWGSLVSLWWQMETPPLPVRPGPGGLGISTTAATSALGAGAHGVRRDEQGPSPLATSCNRLCTLVNRVLLGTIVFLSPVPLHRFRGLKQTGRGTCPGDRVLGFPVPAAALVPASQTAGLESVSCTATGPGPPASPAWRIRLLEAGGSAAPGNGLMARAVLCGSLWPPNTHTSTLVPKSMVMCPVLSNFRKWAVDGEALWLHGDGASGALCGERFQNRARFSVLERRGDALGDCVEVAAPVQSALSPQWLVGQRVGSPLPNPACCLWEVRIWGCSWDTCLSCWESGPRPQACGRPLVAIRSQAEGRLK
ncbi:uncharacterized protein LOC111741061 [Pteropus vampyrus]|uniref:Uncharacterized protein LOC111741061 n=1 Tax=Pteropus vampyrus TaxID=132908 RepID=A0A6P6CKJ9_PTEVA|nr:uncharacterized protein LOC111741061 [Pteropus vampyrus]